MLVLCSCVHPNTDARAAPEGVVAHARLADVVVEGDPSYDLWLNEIQPYLFEAIGKPLDPAELKQRMDAITAKCVGEGYSDTRISAVLEPIGPGEVRVRVRYQTGPLVASIQVDGVTQLPELQREAIRTRVGDLYQEAQVERDAMVLLSAYFDHGMIRASVVHTVSFEAARAAVLFTVFEGEVYRIGRIRLAGTALGSEAKVLGSFATREGQVFSRSLLAKDLESLRVRALTAGLKVEIEIETDVDPVARTINCSVVVKRAPRAP